MKKNYTLIFCILTSLVVFAFYAHTLGYSWKHFDENIIYQETILPVPESFEEVKDFISLFGLNNHFEAGNPFYSNISNLRGTPFDVIFCLFIFSIFKKSAFAYHAFSLILHILNACLCFFILNKISRRDTWPCVSTVSILTLFWALHPANIESVLFATNIGALVTYFFCLIILYYFLQLQKSPSFLIQTGIFLCYLIPLLLNEYSVTLALVLFVYLSASKIHLNPKLGIVDAAKNTLKETTPLFLALFVFILNFFFFSHNQTTPESDFLTTLERIFWLSPQIFFHFLKLIFFPKDLSIDQSAFVKLGNTYFEPYSVFCMLFTGFIILVLLISLIFIRKKVFFNIFVLISTFLLSLLPFLHVISPVYNLASERYLYLPLFFLVFGISHVLFSRMELSRQFLTILIVLLCTFGTRAYIRTLDWKDSLTLLKSATDNAPNKLYKGLREYMKTNAKKLLFVEKSQDSFPIHTVNALPILNNAFRDFKKEEEKCQDKIPRIVKFYGLDPKTLKAKTLYLTAHAEMSLNYDPQKALSIFSSHIKDIEVIDSLILDFYYQILFSAKNIDEAERFLNKAKEQKMINSILFVALSDLYEYKYNDLKSTEKFLTESFNYFPYDTFTLFGLKRLYMKLNNAKKFAHYSHLYGLRTRDYNSLYDAASVYIALGYKYNSGKIIKKLLRNFSDQAKNNGLVFRYEQTFGKL